MNKQKFALKPEIILKYLITDDDTVDTLITAKSSQVDLVTTDFDVHMALACVKDTDAFNLNKLRKLFEVVEIVSYAQSRRKQKPIVTDDDVQRIRALAMGTKEES